MTTEVILPCPRAAARATFHTDDEDRQAGPRILHRRRRKALRSNSS
jgi:hypothetical protein